MSFIAILLSIIIELSVKALEGWRHFGWFEQLTDWIRLRMRDTSVGNGPVTLLAILAPVVLGVWLLAAMLNGVWVVFAFAYSVIILSLSLGPHDPLRVAQDYLHALEANDMAAAKNHAEIMLEGEADENHVVTAQDVKEMLFIKLVTHILGVFFWFIILGPVGAALLRANCLLTERYKGDNDGFSDAVRDLHRILLWIPARLTVLGFAITGSFVHTLESMGHISDFWKMDSEKLLIECGLGAMYPSDEVEENQPDVNSIHTALALAKRTVIAWLTVLGIMVLVGWLA